MCIYLLISYIVLWLINDLPDKAMLQGLWDQDTCDL